MNLNALKKFAQGARRKLLSEVASRLDYVLGHDDAYVRSHQGEIAEIRRQLERKSREQLVEEVAYTWFNRIVALRYMDLRGYHKVRVVSPQAGQVQPELLFQIKQGRTPPEIRSLQTVFDGYLSGTLGSDQPDREIYTAALLGICNDYSRTLPFLFRKVDEYMVALLPTDLLSESSILTGVQGAIGEDDVADVEVIGWLYQFYISEKKDQVFGRPKGEKIKKEDIPAATQLFTPHWIVRYMVENSLGRLWRNNRPDTGLSKQMEYYIEGDPEPEFLTIEGPEEITLLDPACGSGHILTYAFDLLYGMYEETGYSAEEIPSLILTNNLYGIDIDTRAAELASFALTMKAREKDRFFFKRGVVPRVVAMEDVSVDLREADIKMSPQLQEAFGYLSEATNFGSLIPVPAEVQGEIEELLAQLDARGDADLFADQAMTRVRSGLRQLGYLARRYHCVVTNPPYLTTGNTNFRLKTFVQQNYASGKGDLFAAFILKNTLWCHDRGYTSLISQQSWMFLPAYEKLRASILRNSVIMNAIHLGPHAFETIGGEVVQTVAWVMKVSGADSHSMRVVSLYKYRDSATKEVEFFKQANKKTVDPTQFKNLPGQIFAYWASQPIIELFSAYSPLRAVAQPRQGIKTGNNDLFLRFWYEVSYDRASIGKNKPISNERWIPCTKGGSFRRWYGNNTYLLDWEHDGYRVKNYRDKTGKQLSRPQNTEKFFLPGVTWSSVSGQDFGVRLLPAGFGFESMGSAAFVDDPVQRKRILGFLNSTVAVTLLNLMAPALHYSEGMIGALPFVDKKDNEIERYVEIALSKSRTEWNSREESWEFQFSHLLADLEYKTELRDEKPFGSELQRSHPVCNKKLRSAYREYSQYWTKEFEELKAVEERINEKFINAYGLSQDLTPKVQRSEITILQNELDRDALTGGSVMFVESEIMKQLVSYGVGCIFGRYSLDKDGLILANAGDDFDTYLAQIPKPTLRPDESGILPITDDNDFADDLPSQWRLFLRAAFGDDHYEENLRFLEDGLGKRLRQFFLKGFYDDHVKRYKKRPIYWLITSPKGTLQALIYLHRYNRDTVNRFLNDYLRPYQQKL
ncbi:MAG: BREX-1 system adenine-specific DNA-methyltransferase PglX, partial [Alkalispirochaeta sp.]